MCLWKEKSTYVPTNWASGLQASKNIESDHQLYLYHLSFTNEMSYFSKYGTIEWGWQFVFECRVCVMSINEFSTIWVNTNLTHLLNESRFLNPNTTCLLNGLVVSTNLSDFIKVKK